MMSQEVVVVDDVDAANGDDFIAVVVQTSTFFCRFGPRFGRRREGVGAYYCSYEEMNCVTKKGILQQQ